MRNRMATILGLILLIEVSIDGTQMVLRGEDGSVIIWDRDPRSGRLRWGRLFSFSAGLLIFLFGGMALLVGVLGLATANAGGLAGGLTAVVATNIRADWFRW